jgi:hypothetical protein
MPGSHWMIALTPENFEITERLGFATLGLKHRHRRKAERMAVGDRVLYFVSQRNVFPAVATVTSTFFEDHRPIWVNYDQRPDAYPWRVSVRPDIVLESYEHVDAQQIAPRLLYVKRWPPEMWPLAFQGSIHLLSSQDFRMIEDEMEKLVRTRGRRRERPPRRPVVPPTDRRSA